MTNKDYIPEEDTFFTFDTNNERYQIMILTEDEPMYGVITNIGNSEKEILDIKTWVLRFVKTLGNEEISDLTQIEIQIVKDEDTIIFTGPFYLEISKGCNLTFTSNPI